MRASKPTPMAAKDEKPSPFGKPAVIVHAKVDGGKGLPVEAMAAKPLEGAGYVEPMQRSNPDYRAKLAEEKKTQDEAAAKLAKSRRAFGEGLVPKVFAPSPNSPQSNLHRIY